MTIYIAGVLIASGLFFFLVGSIGMIRLPDFYSRLHSAGIIDTMGLLLSMSGLALLILDEFNVGNFLSAIKIILIIVFIFLTSPTATHAIVDAGIRAGLRPWEKKQ
ncbi:MAG: monovalent cation/H(+) antiporter subunit G [Desulfamplus sp.]